MLTKSSIFDEIGWDKMTSILPGPNPDQTKINIDGQDKQDKNDEKSRVTPFSTVISGKSWF